MNGFPRRFAATVVLLGALSSSRAAPAALPPVDLTGTAWHTEGAIHASARGRTVTQATWFDVEFLPDRRFTATDPTGFALAGGYETRGARALRLVGACDADVMTAIEEGIAAELQASTGVPWEVTTLSQSVRAWTDGGASRLRFRVAFRFRVEDFVLGRALNLREWAVTRGIR